jgi:hypothetical protein
VLDKIQKESTLGDMRVQSSTERKEAKLRMNIRIEIKAYQRITVLAANEKRVFADMLRVLLDEALEARAEAERANKRVGL